MITESKIDGRGTVIYDGECHFCIDQIDRIKNLDRNHEFEYIPRQAPGIEERFPVLKTVDFNTGMRLIAANGEAYAGMDALYQIGLQLPGIKSIAWLYRIPGITQIARLGYALVAANRQRLGKTCKDGACEIHDKQ